MQTIYLDISNKGVYSCIYAKQGDVGRKFSVVLTDAGVPYNIPSGAALSVWYSGASGEGNYTDIGNKSAFSVNENKVTVEMIAQMLSNDGGGVLSIVLNDPIGNQISTWNIPYFCEPVPGAESEEAKNYYTAFSQAVENLPYPDASLSVAGKAADAAAVGIGLAGKAPAGYGLGDELPTQNVNDLNLATKTGTYRYSAGAANAPTNSGELVRVESYSSTFKHQTAFVSYVGGNIAERWMKNGVWGEWEWRNPPMENNVEYRTTEKYARHPVYAKFIYCGAIANQKTVSTGLVSGTHRIIRYSANDVNVPFPRFSPTWGNDYDKWATIENPETIAFWCGSSYSGDGYVTIWYFKKDEY